MSISLSLVATQRSLPTAFSEPDDVLLSYADAFVPLAWSMLFTSDEVVDLGRPGHPRATAFASAEAALARLRARGPLLRAAAGHAAEALLTLEEVLAAADGTCKVQLFVNELMDDRQDQVEELRSIVMSTAAPSVARWNAALDAAGATTRLGLVTLAGHGGALADAVTGVVTGRPAPRSFVRPATPSQSAGLAPERDWALSASNPLDLAPTLDAALDQLDLSPSHLDTLTVLLLVDPRTTPSAGHRLRNIHAAALRSALAEYEPYRRRHWVKASPEVVEAATHCWDRVLEDVGDPFAPLAGTPPSMAAWALAQARREIPKRRRSAFRRRPEPLLGVIAGALGENTPSLALDRFELLEWCDGARIMRANTEADAFIARRIDALIDRSPLSSADPLAITESIASTLAWFGDSAADVRPPVGELAMFSVARALTCTRSDADRVCADAARFPEAQRPTLTDVQALLLQWCVDAVPSMDPRARAWLLERATTHVEEALLDESARSCLRLALGDTSASIR